MYAAKMGHAAVVKALLDAAQSAAKRAEDAIEALDKANDDGDTLMHVAAHHGHPEVLNLLIRARSVAAASLTTASSVAAPVRLRREARIMKSSLVILAS